MSWVTVTPSKVQKISLRILRAEWYTIPELVADVKEQMPEVEEQLQEIIHNLCGGTNGDQMNAAMLMPMVATNNEESVLSLLPEKAQRIIRSLLIKEIQRESRQSIECDFSVPVDFTLDDLKKLVSNEIHYSETVSIYDYVYAPVFTNIHGGGYNVVVFVAVNHKQTDQRIFNLINENSRNIVNSLNQISLSIWER
ncbi:MULTISPECIES: hypothetical protein [Acinetobacter]|uniref:Uncharacterized protein n=1 Tax=Acinetobacter indicus TaxID=756892 RepID=A0A6C0Y7E6_9GAMM|nr:MULTISPECIES: hypothetical protein [Acinetobacter]QIC72098.1 hypothetical protein FSC09_17215 [Acinetobacter indicus]QKQ71501.1 hypothetical protein E5Y90_14815 [Acinetobacter sp. 10FS3-1]